VCDDDNPCLKPGHCRGSYTTNKNERPMIKKIFKKLLDKKGKEKREIEILEEAIPKIRDSSAMICNFCNEWIYEGERRRKFSEKVYHRNCFKKIVKIAQKQSKGYR